MRSEAVANSADLRSRIERLRASVPGDWEDFLDLALHTFQALGKGSLPHGSNSPAQVKFDRSLTGPLVQAFQDLRAAREGRYSEAWALAVGSEIMERYGNGRLL